MIRLLSEFKNYVPPTWDESFMRHVYLVASKSKDRRTKIGSVLVINNTIISSGYNGFPRGVNDDVDERHERPEKYFWAEHSERNAVFDCARRGVSSFGSILYTNGVPCSDCSRAVIQAGVKGIIVHAQWQEIEKSVNWNKWVESANRSNKMFEEAGVSVKIFDKCLGVKAYLDGKIFEV